jgi:hypothetical protein
LFSGHVDAGSPVITRSAKSATVCAGKNSFAVCVMRTDTDPVKPPRSAEIYIGSMATAADPVAPMRRRPPKAVEWFSVIAGTLEARCRRDVDASSVAARDGVVRVDVVIVHVVSIARV